jgi:hypothetical protein
MRILNDSFFVVDVLVVYETMQSLLLLFFYLYRLLVAS